MTRHIPLIWATLALLSGCPEPEPETGPVLDTAEPETDPVLNTPPGAPEISITPTRPIAGNDDLLCQIEVPSIDEDGDTITYTMEWKVNSAPYTGTPSTTHHTGDNISGTETVKGDVWECTVTPNDGEEDGPTATASVTIRTCIDLDCAVFLTGEGADDRAGYSVASAGDVNGDGYSDILVGAPDPLRRTGADPGAAYLIYGSSTGISDMSLAGADAKFTGEDGGDNAGWSVASAGDVNGDGYSDILVGAPDADAGNGAYCYAGVTYLIYGSSTGISDMNLAHADALIKGVTCLHFVGVAVSSAGDVNNDGYDDVLVGAYMADLDFGTTVYDEGSAYLIYGSSAGISDMSVLDADARLAGVDSNDNTGRSVSTAGDINADGYADILVGAPYTSFDSGTGYLVLGAGTRLSDMSLASADATLTGEARFFNFRTAGDVNNDGYDDILVDASIDDAGGENAGAAYVILGSSTGISDMNVRDADAKLIGEAAFDWASEASGAGDVNNDGYDDILVGAPGTGLEAGTAYLVLGSSTGIPSMSLSSADVVLKGRNANDYTGSRVSSAGDVNNDGYDDMLVAACFESTAATEAGAVYLLYGGW